MNENRLVTDRWSNPDPERLYRAGWPDEPSTKELCDSGRQCDQCSAYGQFTNDFGICCRKESRHFTETVFEHFSCPKFASPCWPSIDQSPEALDSLYRILDVRFNSGQHDTAERHNEHQP
jgi:hypothetical protein